MSSLLIRNAAAILKDSETRHIGPDIAGTHWVPACAGMTATGWG